MIDLARHRRPRPARTSSGCDDPAALENAKAKYLGKTGALTELLKGLGKLSAAERPAAGAAINDAKQALEARARRAPRGARRCEARASSSPPTRST